MQRDGYYLGIISHKRAGNVQKMAKLVGPATWYVGAGEAPAYREAGAEHVIESGALCRSRNAILDDAFSFGVPAVELSDDLKRLQLAVPAGEKNKAMPLEFDRAVAMLLELAHALGARLAGCAPTNNPFFYHASKPYHEAAFIVGDFIAVLPCDLRFDEQMRLKEDYDYTMQHLVKFGRVARHNAVLASFAHRTNAGGACDYRTSELEQSMITLLKARWPAWIRDNPRRKDEILLRTPKRKK